VEGCEPMIINNSILQQRGHALYKFMCQAGEGGGGKHFPKSW